MMGALRIAHLTPTFFSDASVIGGGERYVDYLVRALATTGGFIQDVVSIGTAASTRSIAHATLRVFVNDAPRAGAMGGVSASLREAIGDYDLVHIHQSLTTSGAYCTALARSAGVPAVGTDLGGGADELMLRRGGIELLDGVISISDFAHRLLGGAFTGRAEVMIGPVDTDAFAPDPAVARDPRMVLCVGRILPHKGVDRIIDALPPDLTLVVLGRVYDEAYHALLLDRAQGRDVRFVHDADDAALLGFYRRAAILVQASTARDVYGRAIEKPELMGLTTLEAMACGLPAIVSDAGSLPELVPDPRFGRVFSTRDDLAALLGAVAEGRWPDPGAASLARDHVVATHGMVAIGERLAAFYRAVHAAPRWGR
ncbi:glycosyltransferase family 4 protein [Neoroseomonas oryzicola]|uniref:Glycosyltransferase family 4 protein n=1 Tax=Neoroseomonas oryzicola TaxID=535904 RepID=A0A9X9WFL2_9PROT|nr:glycosyltransferase family 4 protein [Neoroseomonas oryzicola]MBR0659122.1 glycosyltransferase family 4 protein [Neoroseomonas oryzicola]NKE17694.1 glycosyltransferase family 4 protein [Neoroseomonas oryzicola]